MDWITILILLLFFLWPVLEGVLRRRRTEEEQGGVLEEQQGEGWDAWPEEDRSFAEEVEAATDGLDREPASVPPPPAEPSLDTHLAPSAEEVRRASERLRRGGAPPMLPPRPRRSRTNIDVVRALKQPNGVARAIVLGEVLGPPRALQPLERKF